MTGINLGAVDLNSYAQSMGLNQQNASNSLTGVSTPAVQATQPHTQSFGSGYTPQIQAQLPYDFYQGRSNSGSGGVVAGVIGLTTLGATIWGIRKGHLFKTGKFGGKFGDWVRNFKLSNLKFWGKEAAEKAKNSTGGVNALAKCQDDLTKVEALHKASQRRLNVMNTVLNGQLKKGDTPYDISVINQKYKLPQNIDALRAEIAKETDRCQNYEKSIKRIHENIQKIQTGSSVTDKAAEQFNANYFSAESRLGKK